ncbi:MAG: hypothetical protein IKA20_03225 [Clostridia bacterium]|nr:hypothetical protein [Clostridia bacterium]
MAYTADFAQEIVTSTRIRLARNFAAYPFPRKMDEMQAEDIVYLVGEGLKKFEVENQYLVSKLSARKARLLKQEYLAFTKYKMSDLDPQSAKLLLEQHLISPALLKSKSGAAFIYDDEESISIMVNEEDHLREQYICSGFQLTKAYERISAIDDGLGSTYDFAFDDKLGYITACPSNLGTGMRASVMIFLPALSMNGELKKMLPSIRSEGLTVRGAYGEGTSSEGYLYQVSNERTLGLSEQELLEKVTRMTMELAEKEYDAEAELKRALGTTLKDKCLRAYGVLTNCAVLPFAEFKEKMSEVRFGATLGFFDMIDKKGFDRLFNDMRPASIRVSNDLLRASEKKCDESRAEIVGTVLPEMVLVKRK